MKRSIDKRIMPPRGRLQIGPRIIRAWFDTVINPLLRSLEWERELLGKANWTWRFLPRDLESLRFVSSFIDSDHKDNLDQILDCYPGLRALVEEHDKNVLRLRHRCQQLQEEVQSSDGLRDVYQKVTSAQSLATLNASLNDLFGAYPPEEHLALLAQYIVNNTGELPTHYSPSRIWNRYRDQFIEVLETSDLRRAKEAVIKAGQSLLRSVERLIRTLRERRLELSSEYDVPITVAGKRPVEIYGE